SRWRTLGAPCGWPCAVMGRTCGLAETTSLRAAGFESETFRALLEIALAVGGELDLAKVAQLAVDHAGSLLGAAAAPLWTADPEDEVLRALARSDACLLNPGEEVAEVSDSIVGQVFRRREPVVVDDYQNWEFALDSIVASGVRSA